MKLEVHEMFDGLSYWFKFDNGFTVTVSNHKYTEGNQVCLMKDSQVVFDDGLFQAYIDGIDAMQVMELIYKAQSFPPNHPTETIEWLLAK
jgi:hypothetical protein